MVKTTFATRSEVMVAKNEEVDDSLFLEEYYNSLANENNRKKSARAKRVKRKMYAKNNLRNIAVKNADEFFSKSKQEQRNAVHTSPYSLKRLHFYHCDQTFESRAKAEKKAKETRREIELVRKVYLGAFSEEVNASLVPTHIEILVDELTEVSDVTFEEIIKDNDLLLFLTNIYKPEKYIMACEYVESVA